MLVQIPIAGAEIYLDEHFLTLEEAESFYQKLLAKCAWQRRRTSFGGPVPRDEAYYGDPETPYTYSKRLYTPLPWLPELLSLKQQVEAATRAALGVMTPLYNAVLCNLYRNGSDSMGLHADAEPEMGPVIASVSLGAERLFRLKDKQATTVFSRALPSGSLLIMAGETQKNLKHEVPKQPKVTTPRINLTFRNVSHGV